jgi:Ala-tRNA(Pro) deacylase
MLTQTLSRRLLQELEEVLLAERERLRTSLCLLDEAVRTLSESQGEESDAGGASADVASDLAQQAVDLSIESVERRRLGEVEDALARVTAGTYGRCQTCGEPIGVERLYALPWARTCIDCARQAERRRPGTARAPLPKVSRVERSIPMQARTRLEQYLGANEASYKVQHHAEAFTALEVAEREHIPGFLLAKVVMAFADGELVMLVLPATYNVDLAKVATALAVGSVRLAHEDEFAHVFPDCEVGAMPPFGNLYSVPVYVDRSLTEDETIVFQAGTHTDTMSMKYADYDLLVQPTVAEFAVPRYAVQRRHGPVSLMEHDEHKMFTL